jgi:Domain of unknown function (DUF4440)
MTLYVKAVFYCACLFVVLVTSARADCSRPELTHQRRDAVTIQRLESAWTAAYLSGDTDFEACLLTSDFVEIMGNGTINHLADELALAAKQKANPLPMPALPAVTVHMHGDVAVAYGISSGQTAEGQRRYFADYYVWSNGSWHVYFAQQTSFQAH